MTPDVHQRRRRRSQRQEPDSFDHGLHAEPSDGPLAVYLDRPDAEIKVERDSFRRNPIGDEHKHLALARRQGSDRTGRLQRAETIVCQMALDHRSVVLLLGERNLMRANDVEDIAR